MNHCIRRKNGEGPGSSLRAAATRMTRIAFLVIVIPAGLMFRSCDKGAFEAAGYTKPLPDSCATDPQHHYFVSLPEDLPPGVSVPLILAIDPHGDGRLAVEKFAGALGGIPAVVAGSEMIRNNFSGFNEALEGLYQDVSHKYPVDRGSLVVAGFSGGARMAWYYGMNHPVKGIIMFGAGPDRVPGDLGGKTLYAVSGTRGFNFIEQYRPLFSDMDRDDYVTDYFRGIHEWPPQQKIHESVAYVLRDGPYAGKSLLGNLSEGFLASCDSLMGAGELFFAGKALEKAWYFAPSQGRRKKIEAKISDFSSMPEWITFNGQFIRYLRKEQEVKNAYMGMLDQPDTIRWKHELSSLYDNLNTCTDSTMKDFYSRIKGFTGILLYSRINQLLQQGGDEETVRKLMVVYRLAEPSSPDLYYFSAVIAHRRGRDGQVRGLLEKAVGLGYNDYSRLHRDFPKEFWPGTGNGTPG